MNGYRIIGKASKRSVSTDASGAGRRTIALVMCAAVLGACGAGNEASEPTDSAGPDPLTVELGAATPTSQAQSVTDSGESSGAQSVPDTDEASGEQLANRAPRIVDTSYHCDPVVESVAFEAGQSDSFTLSVTDESALTLTYAAEVSSSETVNVSVDESGVFSIQALQTGESWVWLTAEDADGLADEYELHVIVQ